MGSFGAWQVQGQQVGNLAMGQQSLGPFSVPFSDATLTIVNEVQLGDNFIYAPEPSVASPGGPTANGLWLFPSGVTGTLVMKGTGSDLGVYINPAGPSYISFDPANYTYYSTAGLIITASVAAGTITSQFV